MTFIHIHDTNATINIMNIFITPKSFLLFLCNSSLHHLPTSPTSSVPRQITQLLPITIQSYTFSRILYQWNYTVCTLFFLVYILLLRVIVLEIINIVEYASTSFLFIAHIIPFCGYTTICLYIHLSIVIWVNSSFCYYEYLRTSTTCILFSLVNT